MKFCPVCQNMLYMQLDQDAGLKLYCKHCSYVEVANVDNVKDVLISQSQRGDGQADYKQYMTPDLEHDPTLPRVRHMECPNKECPSTPDKREVIYLKYDPVHLKFLYFCTACKTFWT